MTPEATKEIIQSMWDKSVFPNGRKVVTLDFETYYDDEYSLRKISTSEYIRDRRFKAQMVGIKIGKGETKIYQADEIEAALHSIDWSDAHLLCHNTAFDGFILSDRYGITPKYYFDTLSMARGLHSNEIGANLNAVAQFYGKGNKLPDVLDKSKGVRVWDEALTQAVGAYCKQDVDLTYQIFLEMGDNYPQSELDLINLTIRMFCESPLLVDIERARKEYKREKDERVEKLLSVVPEEMFESDALLKSTPEKQLKGIARKLLIASRLIGSNARFSKLLEDVGVTPPMKISPAWLNKPPEERDEKKKWTHAFSKTDLEFIGLPDDVEQLSKGLDLSKHKGVEKLSERQEYVQRLVDARLVVKSTMNINRAERFIKAGEGGKPIPIGYSYYRAHTGRFGGNNKLNMQNLPRGGELRKSILAQPNHVLVVCDSSQIEVRVNAWMWDQLDLLELFAKNRDVYSEFATKLYGRTITKKNELERHIGKQAVLGLGYGMGWKTYQLNMAKGFGGRRVSLTDEESVNIVTTYRTQNSMIVNGWGICKTIIFNMASGQIGEWKCIKWGKEHIELPNGMHLKYPYLHNRTTDEGSEWVYKVKDAWVRIYPSKLTENIVQALARIVVTDQMLAIDKQYRVVMTTHDEVVAHCKAEEADDCFAFMLECMKTTPKWCPTLPLAAEGGYAENYSK